MAAYDDNMQALNIEGKGYGVSPLWDRAAELSNFPKSHTGPTLQRQTI